MVFHGRDDKIILSAQIEKSVLAMFEKYKVKHEKHIYDDCSQGVITVYLYQFVSLVTTFFS